MNVCRHVVFTAGIYRNFTYGLDLNALCEEDELNTFCNYVSIVLLVQVSSCERVLFDVLFLHRVVDEVRSFVRWLVCSPLDKR
jgi:hypothetical protein